MAGPSTVDSHPWSWPRPGGGDDDNDRPSGESNAAQMMAGTANSPEFDFQYRYAVPLMSTRAWGSMDPPRLSWQMTGAEEVSVNGPVGVFEVAIEMHSPPVDATSVA